mgnify:CR=1 FL=1
MKSFQGHSVKWAQIGSSWNSSFGPSSTWMIAKLIRWCFLPKGNLRPILWSLGSLWWPQISQNKLTSALFLRTNEKTHCSLFWFSVKVVSKRRCSPQRPQRNREVSHFSPIPIACNFSSLAIGCFNERRGSKTFFNNYNFFSGVLMSLVLNLFYFVFGKIFP